MRRHRLPFHRHACLASAPRTMQACTDVHETAPVLIALSSIDHRFPFQSRTRPPMPIHHFAETHDTPSNPFGPAIERNADQREPRRRQDKESPTAMQAVIDEHERPITSA